MRPPLWGELSMLNDNINFVDKELFPQLMGIFGWKAKEWDTHDGLAVVRADFYPCGHVLAFSSRAQCLIVCDGEMCIEYDGHTFTDFEQMEEKYGTKAYETFPDWTIKVEKQWAIKRNGQWVMAFSNLAEIPYRKAIQTQCRKERIG